MLQYPLDFSKLDSVVGHMNAGGIIEHLTRNYVDQESFSENTERGRRLAAFTIAHFLGAIIVFVIGILLAVLSFMGEVCTCKRTPHTK